MAGNYLLGFKRFDQIEDVTPGGQDLGRFNFLDPEMRASCVDGVATYDG
jgi:hypothetical protein